MSNVFDKWISSLVEGKIGREETKQVFEETKKILANIVVRRGLWNAPPAFLGLTEYKSSWSSSNEDALWELTGRCFQEKIWKCKDDLKKVYQTGGTIEGRVRVIIRNYVHDLQRSHDPVGASTYKNFKKAISICQGRGIVDIVDGKILVTGKGVGAIASPEEILVQWEENGSRHNTEAYLAVIEQLKDCAVDVPVKWLLEELIKRSRQEKMGRSKEEAHEGNDMEERLLSVFSVEDRYDEYDDFKKRARELIGKVKERKKKERLLLLFNWLKDTHGEEDSIKKGDFAKYIGLSPSRVTELFKELREVLAPLKQEWK